MSMKNRKIKTSIVAYDFSLVGILKDKMLVSMGTN